MSLRVALAPWQHLSVYSPYEHTALVGGVATGKTFTGSHFAIDHFVNYPDITGFIGANTYDQLHQATLKELFHWLEYYGFEYVYNQIPPEDWGEPQRWPSYRNILSVNVGDAVAYAFTRILSDPDALRGIQFSWYWMDESRDTPQNTHDVILSRMRESKYKKGLITTTPNAEDWVYERFMKQARPGQRLKGTLHVPTIEAVRAGIITQSFYDMLRSTYSPLMAAQELDALHVNVKGGRAYYAFGDHNRKPQALWGDRRPDPTKELIIGADFNFAPAPHIWIVGQVGYIPRYNEDGIHWFQEIAKNECSTVDMTYALINQFGRDFFYRIYGDRSGMRATTSNAGKHDYDQMAQVLGDEGCLFSIDSDTGNNPLVRNRVENMNRLAKDALGRVRQTYDPTRCPHFDSDVKMVGWKPNILRGQGRLDNGGNVQLTHASDGAGYAVWKLFPYQRRALLSKNLPSLASNIGRR